MHGPPTGCHSPEVGPLNCAPLTGVVRSQASAGELFQPREQFWADEFRGEPSTSEGLTSPFLPVVWHSSSYVVDCRTCRRLDLRGHVSCLLDRSGNQPHRTRRISRRTATCREAREAAESLPRLVPSPLDMNAGDCAINLSSSLRITEGPFLFAQDWADQAATGGAAAGCFPRLDSPVMNAGAEKMNGIRNRVTTHQRSSGNATPAIVPRTM